MESQQVLTLGQEGLMMLLTISAPLLLVVLVVGLVVSIFQAATQIHEATLSFVPKLVAAVIVLVVNASEALGKGGEIRVTTQPAESGQGIVIRVKDNGPGIPSTIQQQIFEPFYTSQPGGTGLGLYISRELAERNGAALRYQPRAGGGSIFRIVFADPKRWQSSEDSL